MLEATADLSQKMPRSQPVEARKCFRVACLLPIWFRPIPDIAWPEAIRLRRYCPEAVLEHPWLHFDRHESRSQRSSRRGEVLNLSADGLLLLAKTVLGEGSGVELALQIPNLPQPLGPMLAKVVWAETNSLYRAGLQFINLPEIYRENLVAFVFKQQRQLRRQQTFV